MASHHQPGNVVPLEELLAVVKAARRVLAGLNARIAAAPLSAVPIFDGIAELHDALGRLDRLNP